MASCVNSEKVEQDYYIIRYVQTQTSVADQSVSTMTLSLWAAPSLVKDFPARLTLYTL